MTCTSRCRVALCIFILGRQVLSAQVESSKSAAPVYVGLLDDSREQMSNWRSGVASERVIRPAFEKRGNEWKPIVSQSFPHRFTWIVSFNGTELGKVTSQDPSGRDLAAGHPPFLSFVQTILTPASQTPSVGSPSTKYSAMGLGPTKGRRPLVVDSRPPNGDPDDWKRISGPTSEVAALVRAAFRSDLPHANQCKKESVVRQNWKFPDSSLAFVTSYVSNKGSYLVETSLDAGDCGYVDDPNDPLSEPWFFVSKDGQTRRIGSFMKLLDAGDYDGDGRSELIFILNQPEDLDGFILFDSNLRKQASLTWTYH